MPILDTSFLVDLMRGREEALALPAAPEGRVTHSLTTADNGPGAILASLPLGEP
jgi:predicted nucleic acid-binding protein